MSTEVSLRITNGLSIDVDEFVCAFSDSYGVALDSRWKFNISSEIDRVLRLLKESGIFATFFVNGKSVVNIPDVIKRITGAGHEIGCHGFSHKYINQYKNQREFEEDIEKCLELIDSSVGISPAGYRAPGCTILLNKEMVLSALKKYGFIYDSSVTSFGLTRQHGCSKALSKPFKWDNGIAEFPLSSASFGFFRVPAFGSYFLRILPKFLTDLAISRLNRDKKSAFFYFHGSDLFSVKYPKEIMNINFPFVHVYNLFTGRGFEKKLVYILNKYRFAPYRDFLTTLSDLPLVEDPACGVVI